MAPSTFVDMVRVASASAGVGPLVLGPPVTAFQGTTALIDGNQYSYSIQQEADDTWEYGQGIWTAATNTLARGVIRSSLGTSPIGLRAGTPISITVLAEDFAATDQAALAAAVASAQQSAADADADAVATAADRVQTGLDRTAAAGSATNAATSAGQSTASATAANNSAVSAAADAATASAAVGTVTAAATAAAGSATTASNAATAAGTSATNAATSATAAAGSATAAAGSATTAGNNAASTAADRVQTGLDRTAAANSATSAGLSESNAAASATAAAGSATTAQNRATDAANSATAAAGSATNAFNSATAAGGQAAAAAASATATAADRVQTGLDRTATQNAQVAADADAAQTSADRIQTSADVVTTGQNVTAAAFQVSLATTQAGIAATAASTPVFRIQVNPATPTVPPAGVSNGDQYYAVDPTGNYLVTYLDTAGTGVPTSPVVKVATASLVNSLINDAMVDYGYTGALNIDLILHDSAGGVGLAQDLTSGMFVGALVDQLASTRTYVALPTGSVPLTTKRVGVSTWGQSNSNGTNATPVFSTSQPYANLTFTLGPRSIGPTYAALLGKTNGMTGETPLIENTLGGADGQADGTDGETTCAGAANDATTLRLKNFGGLPSDCIYFSHAPGFTGQPIANLRKGQQRYANLSDGWDAMVARASAAGHTFSFLEMTFMEGETDAISNTYAAYLADELGLFAEVRADMKAKSGQSWDPHILRFQTPYRTITNVSNPSAHPGDIQRAQFDVVNQDPLTHFIAPLYIFTTGADHTHYTNVSNRLMAFYRGRAQYQLREEKRVPDCLWPLSATVQGTTVRLKLRVPTLPLRLDPVTMFPATDYGIKIVDDTGTLTLSGWTLSGDTLIVTINRALGANPYFRIGLDYAGTGQLGIGYGCANLRDSTPGKVTINSVDYPVWHAVPQCQLPIIPLETNL